MTPVIRELIDPGCGHARGLLGVLGALKFTWLRDLENDVSFKVGFSSVLGLDGSG
jgi:hypothetical protein